MNVRTNIQRGEVTFSWFRRGNQLMIGVGVLIPNQELSSLYRAVHIRERATS